MPYLDRANKDAVDRGHSVQGVPGALNYKVTQAVRQFLGEMAQYAPAARYEAYNAAIGALECAKLELYRRRVSPYEDKKIEENGDVYGPPKE